jgi:hypothetical protein
MCSEAGVKSSRGPEKQGVRWRETAKKLVGEDFEMMGSAAVPSAAGFTTAS